MMGLLLTAGCAARSTPPPIGRPACGVVDLGQLGSSSIPVTVSDRDSLLSVARALDSAASQANPDSQPFAFEVRFARPLMARSGKPPRFVMKGSFAGSCEANDYLALGWGYPRQESDRAYAAVVPFDPPRDCPGKATTVPSIEAVYAPPSPEPAADHPAIQSWSIDFPQIDEALRHNRASFRYGVEALEVTTVRRLRRDRVRSVGCVSTTYYGIGGHRRLDGRDDSRPTVELIEAGRPSKRASLAGYCTEGHYLILDAATGATVERGRYRRCEFFAAERI